MPKIEKEPLTTVPVSEETLKKLHEFKDIYGFHSLDELIEQLLTNAKILLLKEAKKDE